MFAVGKPEASDASYLGEAYGNTVLYHAMVCSSPGWKGTTGW